MFLRSVVACFGILSFFSTAQNENVYSYSLGPGDTIEIQVYGEPDLNLESVITDTGSIDYPYLGEIKLDGKTPAEVKETIENGLRGDYLLEPEVMVRIVKFRQIYINGEVRLPGGFAYQPGLTVERAIALAGGFTIRANKETVDITSSGEGKTFENVSLQRKVKPGDIIVVEPTFF